MADIRTMNDSNRYDEKRINDIANYNTRKNHHKIKWIEEMKRDGDNLNLYISLEYINKRLEQIRLDPGMEEKLKAKKIDFVKYKKHFEELRGAIGDVKFEREFDEIEIDTFDFELSLEDVINEMEEEHLEQERAIELIENIVDINILIELGKKVCDLSYDSIGELSRVGHPSNRAYKTANANEKVDLQSAIIDRFQVLYNHESREVKTPVNTQLLKEDVIDEVGADIRSILKNPTRGHESDVILLNGGALGMSEGLIIQDFLLTKVHTVEGQAIMQKYIRNIHKWIESNFGSNLEGEQNNKKMEELEAALYFTKELLLGINHDSETLFIGLLHTQEKDNRWLAKVKKAFENLEINTEQAINTLGDPIGRIENFQASLFGEDGSGILGITHEGNIESWMLANKNSTHYDPKTIVDINNYFQQVSSWLDNTSDDEGSINEEERATAYKTPGHRAAAYNKIRQDHTLLLLHAIAIISRLLKGMNHDMVEVFNNLSEKISRDDEIEKNGFHQSANIVMAKFLLENLEIKS